MVSRNDRVFYVLLAGYIGGGAAGIVLSFVYHLNKQIFGAAFLGGALVGLFIVRHKSIAAHQETGPKQPKHSTRVFKVTLAAFVILFNLSVFALFPSSQNHALSLGYFVCVTCAAFLIFVQITYARFPSQAKTYLILFEIFLISSLISTAPLLLFPGGYGNDSPTHTFIVQNLLQLGHVGQVGIYENMPGYHIISAAVGLFANAGDLKLIQFVVAEIQVVTVLLLVFVLVQRLFNTQVALFSSLLASLCSYVIEPRFMYFPSNFEIIFFLLVLSVLFLFVKEKRAVVLPLFLISVLGLVFTHQFGPFVLITFLIGVLLASRMSSVKVQTISEVLLLLCIVVTFGWWMIPYSGATGGLFSTFVFNVQIAVLPNSPPSVTSATLAPLFSPIDVTLIDLGSGLLTFLGVAGSFCVLGSAQNNTIGRTLSDGSKASILSIVTLLLVPVPFLFAVLAPNSLPDRWFVFTEILLAIFGGAAILFICSILRTEKRRLLVAVVATCTVFFMITTPVANPNNQLYAQELSGRQALTQPELDGLEFAGSLHPAVIYSNSPYGGLAPWSFANLTAFINPKDPSTYDNSIVAVRSVDQQGFIIPLFGNQGKLLDIIPPDAQFYGFLNTTPDKLYANGNVSLYYNPPS